MAKLDSAIIYGTLNVNGELTTRKNTIDSKGIWFKTDLDTAGYISFTTNAATGYKFDKDIYSNGGKVWHSGNDGSGSGLDADKLDGIQASQFLRNDITSIQHIKGKLMIGDTTAIPIITLAMGDSDTGFKSIGDGQMQVYANNVNIGQWSNAGMNWTKTPKVNGASILTTSAGKSVDSNLLDGINSSSFVRSDAADTITGDLTLGNYLIRNSHSKGFLVGSYNSVGSNGGKTNPIYTIGASFKSTDTTLVNMHGIGYANSNEAPFLSSAKAAGLTSWGMYVCAAGVAKIFLDSGGGQIWSSSHIKAGGSMYEGGVALSSKYLGKTAKSSDSNLLDGINSSSFLRSDTADTFTGTLTASFATGARILNVGGTASGIFKFTDQNSLCLHSDSACMLFAGDSPTKILIGLGYNNTPSSAESAVIAADSEILFFPTQQSGFNNAYRITMSSGNIVASGNVSGYSDERIKTNIKKIESPLEKIDQINGYTFERKDLENRRDTGVLAQEIEKILPEVITEVNSDLVEGKLKTVDYGKISGLLIECIKELKKEIEELKGQV